MGHYEYHESEPELWTVYAGEPSGRTAVSDHASEQEARDEALRLNGGMPRADIEAMLDMHAERITALEDQVTALHGLDTPPAVVANPFTLALMSHLTRAEIEALNSFTRGFIGTDRLPTKPLNAAISKLHLHTAYALHAMPDETPATPVLDLLCTCGHIESAHWHGGCMRSGCECADYTLS